MVFSLYYFQVEKKSKDYIAFQGKIFPIGISKSKENIGKKGGWFYWLLSYWQHKSHKLPEIYGVNPRNSLKVVNSGSTSASAGHLFWWGTCSVVIFMQRDPLF